MNKGFQIRRALPENIDKLQNLFSETIAAVRSSDYNAEQVQIWVAAGDIKGVWLKRIHEQYFICAVWENIIVGFASLANNGYLDLMYVHKDYQRRGVASLLYHELESYSITFNLGMIYSDVSITASPFFEKMGFKIMTEQRKKIGETEFINYRMEKFFK